MKKFKTEIVGLAALGAVSSVIISMPAGNLSAALALGLSYFLLCFMPFVIFVDSIAGIGFTEKFLLANVAGISYSAIYIIFDVIFKIPLTKVVFLAMAALFYAASAYLYLKK